MSVRLSGLKTLLSQGKNEKGMRTVLDWLGNNWVEVVAAAVSITYVILTIRQVIWLWLFGILSAILYAWVYAHSGFYAGMALQGYYAAISIYGWLHWSSGKRGAHIGEDTVKELPVARITRPQIIGVLVSWLVIWLVIAFCLNRFTDSRIPLQDAFTASGGIVATWMLARKILEQWIFWIIIDLVSVGLYVWQGLYATTVLFIVYVVMAVFGYREWRKAWKNQR